MDRHALVKEIVDYLFTNGYGEPADRLVMMTGNKDIGGWGRKAVVEYLTKALVDNQDIE
jgi:hypothetical protein